MLIPEKNSEDFPHFRPLKVCRNNEIMIFSELSHFFEDAEDLYLPKLCPELFNHSSSKFLSSSLHGMIFKISEVSEQQPLPTLPLGFFVMSLMHSKTVKNLENSVLRIELICLLEMSAGQHKLLFLLNSFALLHSHRSQSPLKQLVMPENVTRRQHPLS